MVNEAVASLGSASAAQGALDVVGLAMELENIAAETYVKDTDSSPSSWRRLPPKRTRRRPACSSIQPVEMQHIAILYYVLGMYPGAQTSSGTPLAFNPTSMAV
ncbi:MAG: hypothetical protein ABSE98_10690 [Acidimicrobiales bacterium]